MAGYERVAREGISMRKFLSCFLFCLIIMTAFERHVYSQGFGAENEGDKEITVVNGLFLIGESIVEFAQGGRRTWLYSHLLPYLHNDRLYFFSMAFPLSIGHLHNGFRFNIEFSEAYFTRPRLLAVYQGLQRDHVPAFEAIPVRGFAERGRIIITHVFFCMDEAGQWLENVKVAF